MGLKFMVSRTFQEVTPESAEDGDFSDNGFVFEDQEYTLRELMDYIKLEGFEREYRGARWLTTGPYTECYRTGTEREEHLHVKLIKGGK